MATIALSSKPESIDTDNNFVHFYMGQDSSDDKSDCSDGRSLLLDRCSQVKHILWTTQIWRKKEK